MKTTNLSNECARFSAYQLQTVGIFLLRHDAAAGAERVAQLHEGKLLGAVRDQVFGKSAQVAANLSAPKQHVRWKMYNV